MTTNCKNMRVKRIKETQLVDDCLIITLEDNTVMMVKAADYNNQDN